VIKNLIKNKTIFHNKKLLLLCITIFFSIELSASQVEGVIDNLIRQFAGCMQLNSQQIEKIRTIFSAAEKQLERDRAMFLKNDQVLNEAAKRRRDMIDRHIQSVLEAKQVQKYPQFKSILSLSDEVIDLMSFLKLSYSKAYRTAEIINNENRQAKLDQQTYRKSAKALIASAYARRQLLDDQIETFLNSEQFSKYQELKQERELQREFFELKQGLVLNSKQSNSLEKILAEFHTEEPQRMKKRRGGIGIGGGGFGPGGGGMMPGGNGGQMRGGDRMPGGEGMMGRGGGRGNPRRDMMEKIREREAEKEKKISEILSPEQKVLYFQILKTRKEEMEKKMMKRQEGNVKIENRQ